MITQKKEYLHQSTDLDTEPHFIEVFQVTRTFQLGEIDVHALRGIDLNVNKGEFVAILGSSGSGKTTLLNQIGAIDSPTSGRLHINGKIISNLGEKELNLVRRDLIGWVFQFHNLIPSLTALENVQLGLEVLSNSKDSKIRALKVLKAVGLEEFTNRFPSQLSGGQQQRIAIARALIKEPEILVADEPTGNLDHTTSKQIMELLLDLNKTQGTTFIMVTHDRNLARYADRIIEMEDGLIKEETNGSGL